MKYSCIQKDRLVYNRSKTKDRRQDGAAISVKIEKEIKCLFDKYADPDGVYVFSFYKKYSDSHTFNAAVNKGLKQVISVLNDEINKQIEEEQNKEHKEELEELKIKDISAYFARHSWATIARYQLNISTDDIALCLNHVNEGP